MTQYVLLYFGGGMPETEAEQAKVMQAWGDWYTTLGSAVVDTGNPFNPVAKSIASDGTVSDGAVGPMSSGYTILEADSLDQAVKMAQGCPILKGGGEITVFETYPAM
jgi:hypothetical protein